MAEILKDIWYWCFGKWDWVTDYSAHGLSVGHWEKENETE